jgi:hypothetical protein
MNEQVQAEIAAFVAERDEVLLSLDKQRILDFWAKYDVPEPSSEHAFWGAVHKARTGNRNLPMDARSESKRWLLERGMTSFDDGDVPV